MRLIKVDCANYKRLRKTVPMDVDPRLVCIVGPNEAGKSSFLDALTHLNHDDDFAATERTRGVDGGAAVRVAARFVLEEEDKAALVGIPEAADVRQAIISKRSGQPREWELDPEPSRDLAARTDVAGRLQRLRESRWLQTAPERAGEGEDGPTLVELVEPALTAARVTDETLDPSSHLPALTALLERLRMLDLSHQFRGLPDRLERLIAYEREQHPYDRAIDVLSAHLPSFMKFGESERDLAATHNLAEPGSNAIRNLLQLAGTDYEETQRIASSGDKGQKTAWLDRTKQHLHNEFTTSWKQSALTVRLDLDGMSLSVLMSMQADDFIEIDQRSDGLRQFVALRSYVALSHGKVKPVLLIDEAERHLHYDAQADLIQVLEAQREASKVIYTTHSAGCLPSDLGTGVRAIVPTFRNTDHGREETDDSEVVNKFWTRGRGFSPLLIAMGAGAFAFSAMRRAVIAEGMSETVLLPTLIREALGVERLDYQVAPSFAEISGNDVADLDLVASRVSYLADGDKGGQDQAKKLRANGVRDEQIVFLGGEGSGLSLEDLLAQDVYLNAVNEELARWHSDLKMNATQIPEKGRSWAVERWCRRQTTPDGTPVKLSKVDVVQRVLDQRGKRRLVAQSHRQLLRDLDEQLRAVLDRPSQSMALSEHTE